MVTHTNPHHPHQPPPSTPPTPLTQYTEEMVTALMLAAKLGSNAAALAMLESGADVTLRVSYTVGCE